MSKTTFPIDLATEWLTPQDAIRFFKLSKSKFYYWANGGAFPIYRPRLPGEKGATRTMFVKLSEVQAFLESGRAVR